MKKLYRIMKNISFSPKKIRILVFVFLLTLSFYLTAGTSRTYISLGEDCQTALVMRDLAKRNEAYPFDWNISCDFNLLIKAFKENFKNFVNPNYLRFGDAPFAPGHGIYNHYYGLVFLHDFPHQQQECQEYGRSLSDFMDYLPEVSAKYQRRIKRLKDVLISTKPVIFIRTATHNAYQIPCTPTQAKGFVKTLKKKYPQLPFLLVVIHNKADFNYEWKIDKVYNIYFPAPYSWLSQEEWSTLFHLIEVHYENLYE